MVFPGGEYRHDVQHYPASGGAVPENSGCRHAPGRFRSRGRVPPHPLLLYHRGQPDGVSFLQGGKEDAAGTDLQKAPAAGRFLQRAGEDQRGGAGGGGRRGPAGNLFRGLSSPILLCHAGAADPVCRSLLCQYPGGHCPAGLRPLDPHCHCGRADLGQKTPVQILGTIHCPGRHLPGKPAGAYHPQDLSGR